MKHLILGNVKRKWEVKKEGKRGNQIDYEKREREKIFYIFAVERP